MVPSENRPTQIIEVFLTILTLVTLALCLCLVKPSFVHLFRLAFWATHPFRPSQLSHAFKALRVIY